MCRRLLLERQRASAKLRVCSHKAAIAPMLRLVTRFLLLLLIAALPLQGVTAATMMVKGVTPTYATGAQLASSGGQGAINGLSAAKDDDHCFAHTEHVDATQHGKSGKHAGHACPGCAACSLCSVVPYATPLFVHLDNAPAQAPSGLTEAFVSHISDALQRPPASVV